MKSILKLILTVTFFITVHSYIQVQTSNQAMNYYERYSHMPILHVYYNRHFGKSKQFEHFSQVINAVENRVSHYAQILFTDCQKIQQKQKIYPCEQIAKTNENRMLVGYIPSSQHTTYGSKLIQSPPSNKVYDHNLDMYTQEEIYNFIRSMTPQFYKHLHNLDQYNNFLQPYYVPKLVLFWDEDSPKLIPQVLKELSIQYYLKFDFGFVQDLTEQITNQISLQKLPKLAIIKYNFSQSKHQIYPYNNDEFEIENYQQLNNFLQKYALKEQRNDILFHQIKKNQNQQIKIVNTQGELKQFLDRVSGWTIIQKSNSEKLIKLTEWKQQYQRYFTYVHYINNNQEKPKLELYNPQQRQSYPLINQIQFGTLNKDNFIGNATMWLDKDYLVLAVREKYAHLCAITEQTLFRGLVQCFITSESDYSEIAKAIGGQFQIGLVCNKKQDRSGKRTTKGTTLKQSSYDSVYNLLEYSTKLKIRNIMNQFLKRPISKIYNEVQLRILCAYPTKKCVFFIPDIKHPDKTKKDYVKEIALSFAQEYRFFEILPECNQQFILELQQINKDIVDKKNFIVVYHPKQQSLSIIETKMTKTNIQTFLRENIGQKKQLKLKQMNNKLIKVHPCPIKSHTKQQEQEKQAQRRQNIQNDDL